LEKAPSPLTKNGGADSPPLGVSGFLRYRNNAVEPERKGRRLRELKRPEGGEFLCGSQP